MNPPASSRPPVEPRLHVQLLDGVAVRLDGSDLDIGTARPRTLLARLALDPGVRIPAEQLIAELWHEPPASADVTLRSVVSRLRAGPLRAHLHGGRGGYTLEVDPQHVDLLAVRAALRVLPPGPERRTVLERVEAAGAGRAFAGADDDAPFLARERARLDDEYAAALAELARIRLAEGDGDGERTLDGLRALVRRDPASEGPTLRLARVLAEAGRDGEALRAIDALGARLEAELGLDPPPALIELRTSILRGEVVAAGPEPERIGVPLPLTAFVGRRADLSAVLEARARSRLVTIVGPGGVGKTRLAIEALRRGGAGDQRQVFLDLVPFRDRASVLSALAEQLGALGPELDTVARVLRGDTTLLVLDNAEHLRDEIAHLAAGLLARCDGLAVLVTSRDPLRVAGERRVKIEPMLGAELSDAMQLFAARAADVDADFRIDRTTEPLVRSLVAELDGVPLALELAAARLSSRSLPELVAEIRARGTVGRSRGGRHASVTSMIEWSTDLLPPDQRELLGQLGGFAGAFSRDAATAICEVPGSDVDELLAELVERSLVSTARTPDGSTSYRLLIAVREVARDQYALDRGLWRERHRLWHADLVESLRAKLYGHEEAEATAVLERAGHDLLAALDDCVASGDRASGLRIVGGMARVWYRRSALTDGVARIDRALAIPGEAPAVLEARAQLGLGLMRFFMRQPDAAFRAVASAIDAARAADAPSILAIGLGYRGYAEAAAGALDAARASVAEAVSVEGASPAARATVAMIASDLQRFSGAPATALRGLEGAYALAREAGEEWVQTLTAHLIAKVLIGSGRGQEAIDLLAPVVRRTYETGRPTHTIAGMFLIAAATAPLERHAVGARLLAATDAHARRFSWDPDANDPEGNRVHRERLRAVLTDSEWDAAVAEGTRWGLGEAVAACAALVSSPTARRRR